MRKNLASYVLERNVFRVNVVIRVFDRFDLFRSLLWTIRVINHATTWACPAALAWAKLYAVSHNLGTISLLAISTIPASCLNTAFHHEHTPFTDVLGDNFCLA